MAPKWRQERLWDGLAKGSGATSWSPSYCGGLGWYPCRDSNPGARFRKPLLYPPELQGHEAKFYQISVPVFHFANNLLIDFFIDCLIIPSAHSFVKAFGSSLLQPVGATWE